MFTHLTFNMGISIVHFAHGIVKCIFGNIFFLILMQIWLKFVHKAAIEQDSIYGFI